MISIETDLGIPTLLKVVPLGNEAEHKVSHLPKDVEEYLDNAQKVLNVGVPSAAAVELRRTLEAAALHVGVDEKPLVKAIEKMAERGLITANFTGVLGHIRKVGNVGAHASDQVLTDEEVTRAMAFTVQVLRNLFEIPKELELLGAPSDTDSAPTVVSPESD